MEFLSVLTVVAIFAFVTFVGYRGAELTANRNSKLAVALCGVAFPIWFVWAAGECALNMVKEIVTKV